MVRPDKFGKQPDVEWKMPVGGSKVYLAASQIQHHLCVRINDAVKTNAGTKTLAAYTRAISDSTTSEDDKEYARLGRVMRGEAILRLDDVARAQIHFGEQLGLADWVRVS